MSLVTVPAAKLAAAINAARAIVLAKADIPALQCVLITARNGEMTIAATDLTQGVSYRIPCDGDGQWLMTFDRLQSFIQACPKNGDVKISGDRMAQLKCGAVSARIPCLDARDFPDLLVPPAFDGDAHFEGGAFVGLLSRLAPMCERKGRLFEVGVAISVSGGQCRMHVATAAISGWSSIPAPPHITANSYIPSETCSVVASLFDGVPIWVSGDANTLWIKSPAATYFTKCVDCEPADISSVVANAENTATVDVSSLASATKSARTAADGKSNAVYLNVGGIGNFVGATDGNSCLCVPFDCEAGEFSFTLNAEKMAALLSACGAETAYIGISQGSGLVRIAHIQITSGPFMGVICGMTDRPSETNSIIAAYLGDTQERLAA